MAKVGRPPRYKSPEEMQEKIDAYFKECEGRVALDDEGNPLCNKNGEPIIIGAKPPTVTGLALALGFNTRMALLNYQAKPDFVATVTRAKSYIEAYAEGRLFDREGVQGAKFSLANNFKGWAEKQELKQDVDAQIKVELSKELEEFSE